MVDVSVVSNPAIPPCHLLYIIDLDFRSLENFGSLALMVA